MSARPFLGKSGFMLIGLGALLSTASAINATLFGKLISEDKRKARVKNRRVHMANERTFLAWIRTCIGIMAFGFVIEKFIIPLDYENTAGGHGLFDEHQYVTFPGIFLVSLGAAAGLPATYRFRRTEKQIMEDTYQRNVSLNWRFLNE